MKRKYKTKKHIPSIKIVSNNIDKNWKYDSETYLFSHSLYPNEIFNPICCNRQHEYIASFIDKYGKKHNKKCKEIISKLYPHIPTEKDPRNLGYNFVENGSVYNIDIISNKMKSFWDTRRGKRYIKYIEYRKQRDANKKLFLTTSKTT